MYGGGRGGGSGRGGRNILRYYTLYIYAVVVVAIETK